MTRADPLSPQTVKSKDPLPPFIHLTDNRRRLLNLATSADEVLPPIPVKSCLDMGVTSYCTTPTSLQELFVNRFLASTSLRDSC